MGYKKPKEIEPKIAKINVKEATVGRVKEIKKDSKKRGWTKI